MARQQVAAPAVDAGPQCAQLWSAAEVAAFLQVPVTTLHQWRYHGIGPVAYLVGRHLRYDPAVVRRWLVDSCTNRAS